MTIMSFESLLEMSHRYGSDEEYVLAGGGNTSFKENGVMYVKGSGAQLADITPEQFVAMDMLRLNEMLDQQFPAGISDEEREEKALTAMMAARLPGEEFKRPSVESVLHALFPFELVLHVHPALINGLTCGADGEAFCLRLFGEKAVWIGAVKPGLTLAHLCKAVFDDYRTRTGDFPKTVFLKNHGIFIAADSVEEIDSIMESLIREIKVHVAKAPDFSDVGFDRESACVVAPALRMLYDSDGMAAAVFCTNIQVMEFVSTEDAFLPLCKPFTPDHIVYCKDEPLFIEPDADISGKFSTYVEKKGYKPRIVAVRGIGFFALGNTQKAARQARDLFLDAIKIAVYAGAFGGSCPLTDELTQFISNWEVEQYRAKASHSGGTRGRLEGRIAVVTGGAQGFGMGIAEAMVSEGAYIAIADVNLDGAVACASRLNKVYGKHRAIAVAADVTDEASVRRMIEETVLAFGGLDILVSNAGVLIAGALSDMSKKDFDFVTAVNYTGYFLCVKYAAEPMTIQSKYAPGYFMDIIEINSKSGLEGSNKNFAYSGSKFGGIGLTQSFALELVEYGIKVNAVCPGNLLDGPLWSDPERGLFRQYLDSGKVAGAKSTDDVRKFYEAKVPLKRGCDIIDVVRAVLYIIEQKYETGQAVPVTGGQIMLR